ncbi:MAG TPA: hypothetical protein GX497_00465 [Bacillus bacterium]|nr:hypothetical protein [Bacillus sp. (in: firmicutes)]
MIKNIISFIIPLFGLLVLIFSFHFLDKYAATPNNEDEANHNDKIE